MFDEEPVDEHGECRREIHDLRAEVARLKHADKKWNRSVNGKDGWANRCGKLRNAVAAVLDEWCLPMHGDRVHAFCVALDALRIAANLPAETQPPEVTG